MFGSTFGFAVLAILSIKNVASISINENDIQRILDGLQRELVSEDQIKSVNFNSNPTYEYKNKEDSSNYKEESRNLAAIHNMPIYAIDTGAREVKLQQDTMLPNILKELFAHNIRMKKSYQSMKDVQREKHNKDLDRYSKVYLILNVLPDKQRTNEEDVDGITRLISKKIIPKKGRGKNGPGTYLVKDDRKGRRSLDSGEYSKYADDDNELMKRPRNRYSEARGGGRTAIPYIHRYVYEE